MNGTNDGRTKRHCDARIFSREEIAAPHEHLDRFAAFNDEGAITVQL